MFSGHMHYAAVMPTVSKEKMPKVRSSCRANKVLLLA